MSGNSGGSSGGSTSSTAEFLFASHGLDNAISVFRIESTSGVLTEVTGSPFASVQPTTAHTVCTGPRCDSTPRPLAVTPSGNFLYVVNPDVSGVMAYRIDRTSGALTSISSLPYDVGNGAVSIAVSEDGKYLYVDSEFPPEVTSFIIDSQSGSLRSVPGSPLTLEQVPYSMTASASNLFIGSTDIPGGILSFNIDSGSGVLTPVAGSPFASGQAMTATALDVSGKFLLAASNTDNSLHSFRLTGGGSLSAASSVAAAANPQSVTAVRGGFVYVGTNQALYGYSLDSSTGTLGAINGFPVNMETGGIASDGSGKFLFVVDDASNSIITFRIDPSTGTLSRVSSSTGGTTLYSNLTVAGSS